MFFFIDGKMWKLLINFPVTFFCMVQLLNIDVVWWIGWDLGIFQLFMENSIFLFE